jgi:hypothetical protein
MSKSNLFAAVANVVKAETAAQAAYSCKVWIGGKGALSGEAVLGRMTTLATVLEWGADGAKVFAGCDLSGLTDAQRAIFRKACGVAESAQSADQLPSAKPVKQAANAALAAKVDTLADQLAQVTALLLAQQQAKK